MKKTLLIAAAALAAGVITSQAQGPVYSQNIVGYVNTVFPVGFTPIVNPLNNGTNLSSTVMPNIPDLSFVYVWNGASYNVYETFAGDYYDESGNTILQTPNLNVGNGVFINASAPFTNTFVGTVAAVTNGAVGTVSTNVVSLVSGFNFLNSTLPVGGGITSALKMNLPDLSFVYVWNGSTWVVSESFGPDFYDETGNNLVPEPQIKVGSAFFVNASSAFQWTITYTNQ